MKTRSGFVSIIGRPNVGKSTFLNTVMARKVSIVSSIPQTTRYLIRGIFTDRRGQIVFIDTPGFYRPQHMLGVYFLKAFRISQADADLILYMVDILRPPGKEEIEIMKMLVNSQKNIIMALNKMDRGERFLKDYIETYKSIKKDKKDKVSYFIPISALRGKNLDRLIDAIFELLPQQDYYYPEKEVTDFPEKLFLADLIREKFCRFLKEELPHSLGVYIEKIEDKEKITYIKAVIYVERPQQKSIVIGKDGLFLKEVGKLAREDLEGILGRKIFLDLWVKVEKDWRNHPRFLREMGFYF